MKQVICNKKSIKRAKAAYRANPFTAGISDKLPGKKNRKYTELISLFRFVRLSIIYLFCCIKFLLRQRVKLK